VNVCGAATVKSDTFVHANRGLVVNRRHDADRFDPAARELIERTGDETRPCALTTHPFPDGDREDLRFWKGVLFPDAVSQRFENLAQIASRAGKRRDSGNKRVVDEKVSIKARRIVGRGDKTAHFVVFDDDQHKRER
jgi:hypothetical protein